MNFLDPDVGCVVLPLHIKYDERVLLFLISLLYSLDLFVASLLRSEVAHDLSI